MKRAVLLAPPLVCVTMYYAFQFLASRLGMTSGYVAGFLLYWIGWCGLFPLWAIGATGVKRVFSASRQPFGQPGWLGAAALGLPLLLGYGYALPRALPHATIPIVAVSALLALINAPLEELLWRGVFVEAFGNSPLRGHLYPAVGFALWHLAPLSVIPNRAPSVFTATRTSGSR